MTKISGHLSGHALALEGRPYEQDGRESRDGSGGGRCSCGLIGEALSSDRARKRWHREHKDEIRARLLLASEEGGK